MAYPKKIFHQLPRIVRKQLWRAAALTWLVHNDREWKDFVAEQLPKRMGSTTTRHPTRESRRLRARLHNPLQRLLQILA